MKPEVDISRLKKNHTRTPQILISQNNQLGVEAYPIHIVSLQDFRSPLVSFSKIYDVRKKIIKLQSLVNERCDFTKKIASKYVRLVEIPRNCRRSQANPGEVFIDSNSL